MCFHLWLGQSSTETNLTNRTLQHLCRLRFSNFLQPKLGKSFNFSMFNFYTSYFKGVVPVKGKLTNYCLLIFCSVALSSFLPFIHTRLMLHFVPHSGKTSSVNDKYKNNVLCFSRKACLTYKVMGKLKFLVAAECSMSPAFEEIRLQSVIEQGC